MDGADRLRDGDTVELPNMTAPVGKPSAVPGATPAPGAGAGRGARAAILKSAICAPDVAKYCAGKTGRDMFMCYRENRDSFSDACRAALKKAGGGHGGGGGGGGGP